MLFNHKSGLVSVEVISDSYNPVFDSRITTFILEYPRIIHSELMTHRVFSRNASSSRAIPAKTVIEQVRKNPAMPVRFGKNQAGMQDAGEFEHSEAIAAIWKSSANNAASIAMVMNDMQAHKQVINRILEPYQFIRVCVTTTNMNNWFWLRNHTDADPTIHALAEVMLTAYNKSKPVELGYGHWHMPFVDYVFVKGEQVFFDEKRDYISLNEALMISSSCAAQTSYRKLNTSLEKAEDIFNKLIESKPCHASPTEHQAKVIYSQEINPLDYFDIEGVTHVDKNMVPWSGNFHGWIQHRQLIKDNALKY